MVSKVQQCAFCKRYLDNFILKAYSFQFVGMWKAVVCCIDCHQEYVERNTA